MLRTQELAVEIIGQVEQGATLKEAFMILGQCEPKLTPQQKGAITDISYGVLRNKGLLIYILRKLVTRPVYDEAIETLLMVAMYQMLYTKAAEYAIVDHAVKHASKWYGGKYKGFVNAVLRNFGREREVLLKKSAKSIEATYNHPKWWIAKVESSYPKQWQDILEASNMHPPMTLRVNHRKTSVEQILAKWKEAGIAAKVLDDTAVRLYKPVNVQDLPGFFDGEVSVQDWGAQFAAKILDVQNGMRVLDACAAPGGKTGHILEIADVELVALDIDVQRTRRIQENLNRLDLKAELQVADATKPDTWWDGKLFDRILADVPCSASGVGKRHPDIRWLRRSDDFEFLGEQQSKMADALWPLLAVNGKMLYATCSIMKEENQQQLAGFLSRHADATCIEERVLLPNEEHDGFYYALIQKN